jgi:glycosyltransferase involved in cell wall biosynthesis
MRPGVGEVRLSGMLVCQDEARRIEACLDALAFCDEIVAVDSGSTDGTLDILRARGVRVFQEPWRGMNGQKDFGRRQARGTWVLNVDADEVVSPALARQARAVADGSDDGPVAFRVPFRNYFREQWVRRCGYWPDPHVRLVRRDRCRWDPTAPVHDRVLVEGAVGALTGHVDHYSFESLDDFLGKSRRYARVYAEVVHARGQRASAWTVASHTLFRFFKAYVLKAGFLDGGLGLVISGLQAYEVFQKYARLWELSRFPGAEGAPRDAP